jgi:hypothetical protein
VNKSLEILVRKRARFVCEYCRMPQSAYKLTFPIDHIIAQQHGGSTTEDNLALACLRCNSYKGPNISGIDPESSKLVRLFNPRKDLWSTHFTWNGLTILGLTSVGRATATLLQMNHPRYLAVRASLIKEGQLFQ